MSRKAGPITPRTLAFAALLGSLMLSLVLPRNAVAHASEMGFVQLLPTNYYMVGGTLAVAASFIVFAMMTPSVLDKFHQLGLWIPLGRTAKRQARDWQSWLRYPASWAGFSFLVLLLVAGFAGSTDPLANPLPLTAWTLFWVLLTLLHAKLGNLWALINPWSGPVALARTVLPGLNRHRHLIRLPERLGFWPATLIFIAFAWFELVSLAPEDPAQLASILLWYWVFHFAAILLLGDRWLRFGEPFSVFFRFISLLSPVTRVRQHTEHTAIRDSTKPHTGPHNPPARAARLRLGLPGYRLLEEPSPGISGAVFVLATLATVSFDGLNKTFWWLARNGVNPLAFEGRSSVSDINTAGLFAAIVVLGGLYFACVWLGWLLSGRQVSLRDLLSLMALAIMPISLAYHFSHYFTQLLVNGQYAIAALNDPFDKGWQLLGLDHFHVTTSFLSHRASVEIIWKLQVAVIVAGHIFSLALAHLLALRLLRENTTPHNTPAFSARQFAGRSQLPLGLLMIAYTLFGLWLISTQTGA